jgi:heme/copper-type cytochrome/quinol oxidase subunit 3
MNFTQHIPMFREHQKAWEQQNFNIIRVWSGFVLSEILAFACLTSSYVAMTAAAYSETSE